MSYYFFLMVQEALKKLYKPGPFDPSWRYSLAVDVAYSGEKAFAAGVVYDMKEKEVVEVKTIVSSVPFPYIPGLLYARETPAILEIAKDLKFDVLILNGHGRLHPRRAGLATVVGILLDLPSIGIAKKLLYGKVIRKGEVNPVIVGDQIEGFEIISKKGKFYASPGNLLDAHGLYNFLKFRGFEYPQELKLADRESKKLKKCSQRQDSTSK